MELRSQDRLVRLNVAGEQADHGPAALLIDVQARPFIGELAGVGLDDRRDRVGLPCALLEVSQLLRCQWDAQALTPRDSGWVGGELPDVRLIRSESEVSA